MFILWGFVRIILFFGNVIKNFYIKIRFIVVLIVEMVFVVVLLVC